MNVLLFTIHIGFSGHDGSSDCVHTNRAILLNCLSKSRLTGYSIVDTDGCYQGNPEPGAWVVIIAPKDDTVTEQHVHNLARAYKIAAQQNAVWVTKREEVLTEI